MYELFCDFNEVQMWFKQKLCSVTFVSKRIIILNMVSFFAILAFFSDMIFFFLFCFWTCTMVIPLFSFKYLSDVRTVPWYINMVIIPLLNLIIWFFHCTKLLFYFAYTYFVCDREGHLFCSNLWSDRGGISTAIVPLLLKLDAFVLKCVCDRVCGTAPMSQRFQLACWTPASDAVTKCELFNRVKNLHKHIHSFNFALLDY